MSQEQYLAVYFNYAYTLKNNESTEKCQFQTLYIFFFCLPVCYKSATCSSPPHKPCLQSLHPWATGTTGEGPALSPIPPEGRSTNRPAVFEHPPMSALTLQTHSLESLIRINMSIYTCQPNYSLGSLQLDLSIASIFRVPSQIPISSFKRDFSRKKPLPLHPWIFYFRGCCTRKRGDRWDPYRGRARGKLRNK